jgi:sugar/nucleoside kinase (ribokinase family)/sugar phosphate isomerase/epimerase
MLESALIDAGVDVSGCQRVPNLPSGQGIVLLDSDGTASSLVVGGSNTAWALDFKANHLVHNAGIVLLQREIPEHVNLAVAAAAKAEKIPIVLDIGGEERPISDTLLKLIDYLAPNESELQRLTGLPTSTQDEVVAAASILLQRGVGAVLVTLAERGATLILTTSKKNKNKESVKIIHQGAFPVPGGKVVDGTAAGDAFRAAFAVALVEGLPVELSLEFAAAAGAVAVSRLGAVPSLPTRREVVDLLAQHSPNSSAFDSMRLELQKEEQTAKGKINKVAAPAARGAICSTSSVGREGASSSTSTNCTSSTTKTKSSSSTSSFPLKFAARLNSMKNLPSSPTPRRDSTVLDWIHLQGKIPGLELVDLNYPQHFTNIKEKHLVAALNSANLTLSAINVRFSENFRLGAFTNPNESLRNEAVQLCIDACTVAAKLGASQLVVWSQYDGYDYNFQMNYDDAWQTTVASYRIVADGCPAGIHVSLEFKPTDEHTRISLIPSTGAAIVLTQAVARPNFGLTLDLGHLLMAGENPAQSVALAAGKLFGMHLNDGHVKLGAEDGLVFGAVNPRMALELVFWLRKVNYRGHVYFDTFPKKENPVAEAELNIKMFKLFWREAERLVDAGIESLTEKHDALGILELLNAI